MSKPKQRRTIPASKVTTISMVAGGEKRISKVIHYGTLKEWVGIGWIDLRKATPEDRKQYPVVVYDN